MSNLLLKNFTKDKFFDLAIIFFFLVCAIIIHLSDLDKFDLNSDEYWHLFVSNQTSLTDVLKAVAKYEVHMPLSYVIWYFMLKISSNDLWLRMSSFIPYLLLIISSNQFAKSFLKNRDLGFLIAFMITFSIQMASLSIVLRYYSLMILLIFWLIIFCCRYLKKSKDKYLIYYFITALLLILLNQFSSIVIFICGLALILKSYKEKKLLNIIFLGHIILALIMLLEIFFIMPEFFLGKLSSELSLNLKNFFIIMFQIPYLFLIFCFGDGKENFEYIIRDFVLIYLLLCLILLWIILLIKKQFFYLNFLFFSVLAFCFYNLITETALFLINRRSLYLITILILFYIYPFKLLLDFKILKKFEYKILLVLKIIILIISIFITNLYIKNDYFKTALDNKYEFELHENTTKSTQKIEQLLLENDNIVIISPILMWKYLYEKTATLNILNDYLGVLKFNSGREIFVFFANTRYIDFLYPNIDYKIFFNDIANYLIKNNSYDNYKNISFFEMCSPFYNCTILKLNNKYPQDIHILDFRDFNFNNKLKPKELIIHEFDNDKIYFYIKYTKSDLINFYNNL
jgi:hypothetical protein